MATYSLNAADLVQLLSSQVSITSDGEIFRRLNAVEVEEPKAVPPETDVAPTEEAVLAAARELLWDAVGRWATETLGEPGAHLAYVRERLAGI